MPLPTSRSVRWTAAILVLVVGGFADPGGAGSLEDELLDNKYRWGDYGVYGGWYEPAGEQFQVHASAAFPLGAKVRLRWGSWARIEADASYYRRGGDARPYDIVNIPEFDGLVVAASLQATGGWGFVRPYAGGGPVFVSLSNDFGVIIREIEDLEPPERIEKFHIAHWNELDVGLQVVAGLDVPIGHRVFPFVEYRHLFGEFATDDIRIGAFRYSPEELKYDDGRDLPGKYDWSGPMVMAGLKIRF